MQHNKHFSRQNPQVHTTYGCIPQCQRGSESEDTRYSSVQSALDFAPNEPPSCTAMEKSASKVERWFAETERACFVTAVSLDASVYAQHALWSCMFPRRHFAVYHNLNNFSEERPDHELNKPNLSWVSFQTGSEDVCVIILGRSPRKQSRIAINNHKLSYPLFSEVPCRYYLRLDSRPNFTPRRNHLWLGHDALRTIIKRNHLRICK